MITDLFDVFLWCHVLFTVLFLFIFFFFLTFGWIIKLLLILPAIFPSRFWFHSFKDYPLYFICIEIN